MRPILSAGEIEAPVLQWRGDAAALHTNTRAMCVRDRASAASWADA
jgi:hypothetical protein